MSKILNTSYQLQFPIACAVWRWGISFNLRHPIVRRRPVETLSISAFFHIIEDDD